MWGKLNLPMFLFNVGHNNPTLNRNIGKFNLPHIWHRVLLNTPGLNLKRHVHAVGQVNSDTPYNSDII